jgi:hypothetical protein
MFVSTLTSAALSIEGMAAGCGAVESGGAPPGKKAGSSGGASREMPHEGAKKEGSCLPWAKSQLLNIIGIRSGCV